MSLTESLTVGSQPHFPINPGFSLRRTVILRLTPVALQRRGLFFLHMNTLQGRGSVAGGSHRRKHSSPTDLTLMPAPSPSRPQLQEPQRPLSREPASVTAGGRASGLCVSTSSDRRSLRPRQSVPTLAARGLGAKIHLLAHSARQCRRPALFGVTGQSPFSLPIAVIMHPPSLGPTYPPRMKRMRMKIKAILNI